MQRSISAPCGALIFLAATSALVSQPPPAQRPGGGRGGGGGGFLISREVPDPAAVERGQKDFVAGCGFCHGSNANGGEQGPDLIRSVLALDDEHGDKIGPVILKGRPDKGMPAFPMTDAQIQDIAAFLRSRQQAAINRGAYTIQNVVTGNAKQGKAYFDGHCGACHTPTGDLAGVGKKYDAVALQSRLLFPQTREGGRRGAGPAARVRTQVTVTPPSGQKISGTLEYLDDFNVALRDASGQYHSFERENGLTIDVRDPLAEHEKLLKTYSDADMHNLLAYLVTL